MKREYIKLALLLGVLACASPIAQAESFSPANAVLQDRAFLVKLEQGTRRVRMQIQDPKTKAWEVAHVSHLSGTEGLLKLRVPDDVAVDQCQVDVSMTDPFPYEFYKGKTGFSQSEAVNEQPNRNVALGGAGAPSAAPAEGAVADKGAAASPDKVQESDLWQWSDKRLFFFNQLRGLQVFDLANTESPQRLATLRMPAVGDQMYLVGSEHAVLITNQPTPARSQALEWWNNSLEVVVVRLRGSKLEIQQQFPLEGQYVESRMVGSRLYIVSQYNKPRKLADGSESWYQGLNINQIDFADPASPALKKPLSLEDNRGYFWGSVVTATPDYLLVSPAKWDEKNQKTRSEVHVIPIKAGQDMTVAAKVSLGAHLKDKFKLRVQDGILTTVTQSFAWGEERKTFVETFDLADATGARKLDQVTLAPRETVFATRFDGDRLYVVTFLLKDPLFVIDLKDPNDLKVLGELDIPGWSTYLVPQGDRLLSIGLEDNRVAVSLFDVADPKKLSLLKRVYPGSQWSWSEANWDEKAVGYLPDKDLLLLPISSHDENGTKNLMQLIDVTDDTVALRGAIEHEVQGRRATALGAYVVSISGQELVVVNASDRDKPKLITSITLAWPTDRVFAYGDYLLQVETGYEWDQNKTASVRVTQADTVDDELAKVTLGQGNILGATVANNALHVLRRQNRQFKVIVEPEPTVEVVEGKEVVREGKPIEQWQTEYFLFLDVVDLKNPLKPALVGSHKQATTPEANNTYQNMASGFLPGGQLVWYPEAGQSFYNPWRWWGPWGGGGIAVDVAVAGKPAVAAAVDGVAGDTITIDWWWWYPQPSSLHLPVYDIANPANPTLVSNVTVAMENVYEVGKTTLLGGKAYVSYRHTEVQTKERNYVHQYRLVEVNFADPAKPFVGEPVNIPGLVEGTHATDDGGLVLFSIAPKQSENPQQGWQSSNALLQASIFDGAKAFLVDEVSLLDGRYTPTAVHDRFVLKGKAGEKTQGAAVYEWSTGGKFVKGSDIVLDSQPYNLAIKNGLLFNQDGNIIDIVALDDLPKEPRKISVSLSGQIYGTYTNRIEINKTRSTAWLATGPYGVETLDLAKLGLTEPLKTLAQSTEEWLKLNGTLPLVRASGQDFVGSLVDGQAWAFRAYNTATDYDTWAAARFNPAHDAGWTLPDSASDADGDGVRNGLEFLADTDPTRADSAAPDSSSKIVEHNGRRYLTIAGVLEMTSRAYSVEVEVSHDLMNWKRDLIVSHPAVDSAAEFTEDGALLIPLGDWRYARLRVELVGP